MKILDLFENYDLLYESSVPVISKQHAINKGMFGPVYHGTNETNRNKIDKEGFRIIKNDSERSNGYEVSNYSQGLPAPIHHLGYGIYFTTVKAIAKLYNGSSTKGLVEYYLDVPNREEINFGSPNTMMNWWIKNGYDFTWPNSKQNFIDPRVKIERARATEHLTQTLSSKWDAVWYKGKGMFKLLDGDQICVYDPERIYKIDSSLAQDWDIGAKVVHNQEIVYSQEYMKEHGLIIEKAAEGWTFIIRSDTKSVLKKIPPPGMKGIIVSKRPFPSTSLNKIGMEPKFGNIVQHWIDVKWKKGGIQYNYTEAELDPVGKY